MPITKVNTITRKNIKKIFDFLLGGVTGTLGVAVGITGLGITGKGFVLTGLGTTGLVGTGFGVKGLGDIMMIKFNKLLSLYSLPTNL
jgi:hypothetical protein